LLEQIGFPCIQADPLANSNFTRKVPFQKLKYIRGDLPAVHRNRHSILSITNIHLLNSMQEVHSIM